ncbi:MAG: hypothetical protein AAGH41_11225 [Pseudomonadota bacterium]
MLRIVISVLILAGSLLPAHADDEPTRLFRSDEPITIRFEGPIRQIVRDMQAPDPKPYPATLQLAGESPETLPITLTPRGNSRRDRETCRFPPLRVRFPEKPGKSSLFRKQKSIKLVVHCKDSRAYEQYVLLEYLAYRLFNVITPQSLNVRLARIEYVNDDNGRTLTERWGFFIEDIDDMADRIGRKEVEIPDIDIVMLDPEAAARVSVFQYMIGNLDWSVVSGSGDDPCCHNGKLVGDPDALINLIPVPYDFDFSGLVDTAYAAPPSRFKLRSVRDRKYRGFCNYTEQTRAAIALFQEREQALLAEIDQITDLSDSQKGKARRYIESFFKDIATPERAERNILNACRTRTAQSPN